VHRQHHARVEIALVERAMHPRHRDLHDVRRGPLDRHIDRHALGGVAHGVHTAGHVRDVAPPSEERLHVALLDAERLRLEDVAPDLRVTLEVLVDEPLRFLTGHLHAPRETEVAHAVDDPEVQHLRDVALLARHRALGDAETRRGGAPVDVRPGSGSTRPPSPSAYVERSFSISRYSRIFSTTGWAPRSSSSTVASVEKPVPVRRPRGSFSSSNSSDCSCLGELIPKSWPTAS